MPAMIVLLGCLVFPGGGAAVRADARYVPTRTVTLAVQSGANEAVDRVRVYVSCDEGMDWSEVATVLHGHSVRFELPGEGQFECFVVLENEAGESSGPPGPGAAPHAVVVVDTTPPVLQIHRVQMLQGSSGERSLRLGLTLMEENLGETGLRLFHRAGAKSPWMDAGPVRVVERNIIWSIPDSLSGIIDVRLTATDLAGNRCSDEVRRVSIGVCAEKPSPTVGSPASQPTSAPVIPDSVASKSARSAPGPYALAGDVSQDDFDRLDQEFEAALARMPASRPADGAAALTPRDRAIQQLRQQANQFRGEGRLSLSAARLREAQALQPESPDLKIDYGNVLLEGGEYAAANEQFEIVLTGDPDNRAALGGLARVAYEEHRFEDARRWLAQRTQRGAASAEDLLLGGDIEMRLGNRAAALLSWSNAMRSADHDQLLKMRIQRRLDSIPR